MLAYLLDLELLLSLDDTLAAGAIGLLDNGAGSIAHLDISHIGRIVVSAVGIGGEDLSLEEVYDGSWKVKGVSFEATQDGKVEVEVLGVRWEQG